MSREKYLEKIIENVLYNELDDEEKTAVEEQIGEKIFENYEESSEKDTETKPIVEIDLNNSSGESELSDFSMLDAFEKLGEEKMKEQESESSKESQQEEQKLEVEMTDEKELETEESEEQVVKASDVEEDEIEETKRSDEEKIEEAAIYDTETEELKEDDIQIQSIDQQEEVEETHVNGQELSEDDQENGLELEEQTLNNSNEILQGIELEGEVTSKSENNSIEQEVTDEAIITDKGKEDNQFEMENENVKTETQQENQAVTGMNDVLAKSLEAVTELKDQELEEKYNDLVEQKQGLDKDNQGNEEIKSTKKNSKKKKGFFSSIFGNVKTSEGEAEYEKMLQEEEASAKAEEEKKARQAEEKAKKAEDKKAEKEQKTTLKNEQKEQKKKEKEEKKRLKQEELERAEEAYQGKINKIGASIVGVIGIAACVALVIGTNRFGYNSAVENAKKEFDSKRYTDAYNEIIAVNTKDSEQELYRKIKTVMYVQKPLNSYYNFIKMDMKVEALDSLVKVLKRYEEYYGEAKELSIDTDLDAVKKTALQELSSTYKLEEKEADELANMEDASAYGQKLELFVKGN